MQEVKKLKLYQHLRKIPANSHGRSSHDGPDLQWGLVANFHEHLWIFKFFCFLHEPIYAQILLWSTSLQFIRVWLLLLAPV